MYRFYKDGFFGYGEPGDFQYWSLWHILPLLLLVLAVLLVYRYRNPLKDWKWEGRARFIFAFVMLLAEMSYFWRLLYVGDETGIDSLLIKLPLQVCQWSLICCTFMMMSENDTLFGINFFISLILGIIPLLMPTVIMRTGPEYYRYYQFWMEHGMPILGTYYMMFVHGKYPRYRHLWYTVGGLMLLSIPSVIANAQIPGANFMFLGGESHGGTAGKNVAQILPESQVIRYIVFFGVVVLLFHIGYGLWYAASHRKTKR